MSIYHQGSSTSVKDAGAHGDTSILWFRDRATIRACHLLERGCLYDTELRFMQFAWLQCGACQGPSHEQLQRTVDDIKAGRRWFCNSILAEAEQCGSIPFSESGVEWWGAWGETALTFVLRPGDIILSQLQFVIAVRSHDKYCGTTPACPDFTVFHLAALNAVSLGREMKIYFFLSS